MNAHPLAWEGIRRPRVIFALGLAFMVVGAFAGANAFDPTAGTGAVWLCGTASTGLVVASGAIWNHQLAKAVLVPLGLTVAVFAAAFIPASISPDRALLAAVATYAQGAVFVWLLRSFARSWEPGTRRDLMVFIAAAMLSAGLVYPLGANPFSGPSIDPVHLCSWALRNTTTVFVGWVTILTMTQRPAPRASADRLGKAWSHLVLVLFTGLAVAAFAVLLVFAKLPLTWIFMIPAMGAGMFLAPRSAAVHGLLVALFAGTVGVIPQLALPSVGWIPQTVLVDVLVGTYVFVCMWFAFSRNEAIELLAELRLQERRSADQAEMLGASIESMSEGMLLVDRDYHIQSMNPASQQLLPGLLHQLSEGGQDVEIDVIGEGRMHLTHGVWNRFFDGEISEFTVEEGRPDLASGMVVHCQVRNVTVDAKPHLAVFARDITSSQQRLDELNNFAATAAHDMRSPITALRGWLEIAQESIGRDDETARYAVDTGLSAIMRIDHEIDQWLGFAVLRNGEIKIEPLSIGPIVDDLRETHAQARISLDETALVNGDEVLTRQLLINLVSNAVKYTAKGVTPHIRITVAANPCGEASIEIADNAVPIAASEEATIFEPFRRGSSGKGQEGTGFGLALCRRIAARHGGSITLRVERGGSHPGNIFTVLLAAPQRGAQIPSQATGIPGPRMPAAP